MRRRTTPTTSSRSTRLTCTVDEAWAVVASGTLGPQWYVEAAPLVVRGAIDQLLGGRAAGRPTPGRDLLQTGDVAGFWRVELADQDAHRLVLTAEVMAPGVVDLTTEVDPRPDGCRVTQTVRLQPAGLIGTAYLVVDLPAREVVIELTHRRLVDDITRQTSNVPPERQ